MDDYNNWLEYRKLSLKAIKGELKRRGEPHSVGKKAVLINRLVELDRAERLARGNSGWSNEPNAKRQRAEQ